MSEATTPIRQWTYKLFLWKRLSSLEAALEPFQAALETFQGQSSRKPQVQVDRDVLRPTRQENMKDVPWVR